MIYHFGDKDNQSQGSFDDAILSLIIVSGIRITIADDDAIREELGSFIHETFKEELVSEIERS